jgi:hypothetical protein
MTRFRGLRQLARYRCLPRRLTRGAPAALALLALVASLLLADALLTRALRAQVLLTSEAAMQTLSRIFVNDHWKELAERMLAGPRAADPRANPDLEMIDRRIRSFAQGTDILKIKLYGPSGLTLYSSDPAQIGENKAANPGVLGALKGNVASELGHRGTIGALDGDRHDRDLVSSYIPIRGIQGIEAVIEIYVDRTAAMGTIDGWRLGLAAVLVAALGTGLGGVWRWGHAATGRVRDLRAGLRAARRREHQYQRDFAAERERAAALLATAGTVLGAPIKALLAAHRHAAPAQASDDHTAGPLSPASLHLLDLRFRALSALAPDPQPSPDSGGTKATVPGLAEVVDAVMNARQAQARAQRCELAAHVDPRLAGHAPPDAGRLHDALELLLASAIAISPSGRVQLKLMASPDAIDIDLTDSAREPVDGSNLDCIIAARLIERLGARLRTQFTAGVGHWHHVRLVLASPDTPGREPATTSECS